MAVPLPPWRPLIRAAQQREGRSPAARWLQLATVALDGTPGSEPWCFEVGWVRSPDLLTDARCQGARARAAARYGDLLADAQGQAAISARGCRQPAATRRKQSASAIGSSSARLGVPCGPGRPLADRSSPVTSSSKSSRLKPKFPNISSCCASRLSAWSSRPSGQHPHLRRSGSARSNGVRRT